MRFEHALYYLQKWICAQWGDVITHAQHSLGCALCRCRWVMATINVDIMHDQHLRPALHNIKKIIIQKPPTQIIDIVLTYTKATVWSSHGTLRISVCYLIKQIKGCSIFKEYIATPFILRWVLGNEKKKEIIYSYRILKGVLAGNTWLATRSWQCKVKISQSSEIFPLNVPSHEWEMRTHRERRQHNRTVAPKWCNNTLAILLPLLLQAPRKVGLQQRTNRWCHMLTYCIRVLICLTASSKAKWGQ